MGGDAAVSGRMLGEALDEMVHELRISRAVDEVVVAAEPGRRGGTRMRIAG